MVNKRVNKVKKYSPTFNSMQCLESHLFYNILSDKGEYSRIIGVYKNTKRQFTPLN